jgi:hypothetical protein
MEYQDPILVSLSGLSLTHSSKCKYMESKKFTPGEEMGQYEEHRPGDSDADIR